MTGHEALPASLDFSHIDQLMVFQSRMLNNLTSLKKKKLNDIIMQERPGLKTIIYYTAKDVIIPGLSQAVSGSFISAFCLNGASSSSPMTKAAITVIMLPVQSGLIVIIKIIPSARVSFTL